MTEHVIMTVSLTDEGRAVLRDGDGNEIMVGASLNITHQFINTIKLRTEAAARALFAKLHGRPFRECPGVGGHTPNTCDSHFGKGIRWRRK